MRRFLCILLALSLLFCLAACSSNPEGNNDSSSNNTNTDNNSSNDDLFPELNEVETVTFWHSITNETIYAAFETIVNNFNETVGKENNVYVETVQYSSAAELNTAVTGAIMSGTAPDIIMGSSVYMTEYATAGALVNMDPYIANETYGIDMNDFYDCWLLNANNYDEEGHYYAMPMLPYSEVMYYNVDFFEENNLTVPTTWDEAEETARTISAKIGRGALGWDNAAKMFSTLAEQSGVGYTDKKGTLLFADQLDTVLERVQWYVDLVKEGVFRTPGDSYYFSGPFANEEIPMYIGSGVEGAYIDMKINPDDPFTWSAAPVPYFKDGKPATISECSMIAICSKGTDSKARLAAWEFIKYFESYDANLILTSAGAYLPCLKSVGESDAFLSVASDAQLAGIAQMDRYYAYFAFDDGTVNSSSLYTDMKATCEDILNNGADLTSSIKALLSNYGH